MIQNRLFFFLVEPSLWLGMASIFGLRYILFWSFCWTVVVYINNKQVKSFASLYCKLQNMTKTLFFFMRLKFCLYWIILPKIFENSLIYLKFSWALNCCETAHGITIVTNFISFIHSKTLYFLSLSVMLLLYQLV